MTRISVRPASVWLSSVVMALKHQVDIFTYYGIDEPLNMVFSVRMHTHHTTIAAATVVVTTTIVHHSSVRMC